MEKLYTVTEVSIILRTSKSKIYELIKLLQLKPARLGVRSIRLYESQVKYIVDHMTSLYAAKYTEPAKLEKE